MNWLIACGTGVFITLSVFFSASRTAFSALQSVDRQRLHHDTLLARPVVYLLGRPAATDRTLLIGNIAANVAVAVVGVELLRLWSPNYLWLNILLVTPYLVLFAEFLPRLIGLRFKLTVAIVAAWPLSFFHFLFWPIRILAGLTVSGFARLFNLQGKSSHDGLAWAELMAVLDRGAMVGTVDPLERDLIESVFEFDDITVARLMTPRPDIFALPLTVKWDELLAKTREARFSRVPIYGSRSDDIVGVLLLKDLLRFRKRPLRTPQQLKSILLPPSFVPASKSAEDMLREFMDRKLHMAFVVDEHGTLVGLVTIDDVLDELIGDIEDGADAMEIRQLHPHTYGVKATMDLDDFEEETGLRLPEGDYHTTGGYVFHELGRLPEEGDVVEYRGYRFEVSAVEGRRIAEIIVHRPAQEAL
ncbi:MAG: HlyC/CorC family transporter [Proteobacteria bacterium]|jgi:putative hemolysin|nr:HlyC/CorC family transporter [Pseudomonadota bacterium]